ncbi:4-hydroxy-tetrahydrodipicolinate synthase [Phaeocystidibacter luteus]|uniref:4-hydroxy-tetrahydrodipicolinate synthase n=1 Tax=Phaeocystidibacter luteus TaxID=911197 RepID=A0A6N6RLM7_9FLAO|nr:4-hydroxy-tetrahydrodipicolinate synthase [Phaeocystidibacter luteus]KAB2814479.1 4-hydroxy-tetrahydrodipicolinate synthase [Phaeocystidibacter luteus]
MSHKFTGTGIALVTPFNSDGSVDHAGLENVVKHCIAGGVEYLVVLGTTGESATLNTEEKFEVVSTVIRTNAGKLPVVMGLGGNNTAEIVNQIESGIPEGIDAILSVSPYYNKPTQEGIYQHYSAIAEVSPVPIILYNVPGRTSSNISAETTVRLAQDFENIVAVKEASGNMEQVMEIINNRPDGFAVISGDDNLTFGIIAHGGDGVISVSGQGYPEIFTEMVRETLAGKLDEAREKHYQLFEVTRMLFAEGNPGGIKAVLKQRGICGDTLRLPLWPISNDLYMKLENETARLTK